MAISLLLALRVASRRGGAVPAPSRIVSAAARMAATMFW